MQLDFRKRFQSRWAGHLPGGLHTRSSACSKSASKIAPMFDADRNAHEAVGDPGLREFLIGEARVRSGFGMAGERFDAAERDGIARDLHVAEKFESRRLAAAQFDRKHRAGIVALRGEDPLLFGIGDQRGIDRVLDLRMTVKMLGDALSIFAGAVHAQADGGQAAAEHPAFVGLKDRAEEAARGTKPSHQIGIRTENDSGEHVAEAREIFRAGVDDEIGAQRQRMLKGGAEQGVIDHHERARLARGHLHVGDGGAGLANVRHDERGIRGRFDEHRAEILRGADRAFEQIAAARLHGDAADAPFREMVLNEMLRAAVDRHGVDDGLSRAEEGEERSHDRGHAGIESDRVARACFEVDDLVLEDFGVGMIEARIDEVGGFAFGHFHPAAGDVECALGSLGAGEDVRRAAKDGRARGADRQGRVETLREDLRGGAQGRRFAAITIAGRAGTHGETSFRALDLSAAKTFLQCRLENCSRRVFSRLGRILIAAVSIRNGDKAGDREKTGNREEARGVGGTTTWECSVPRCGGCCSPDCRLAPHGCANKYIFSVAARGAVSRGPSVWIWDRWRDPAELGRGDAR